MDSWSCYQRRKSAPLVRQRNIKVEDDDRRRRDVSTEIDVDFKPQVQPQTTEKTTKKPKKSKRDAEAPSKTTLDMDLV